MNKRLLHLFEFSRQTLREIALQIPFSMSRYILWQPNAFLIGGDNCQRFVLASLDYSWEMCFEKKKRIKKNEEGKCEISKVIKCLNGCERFCNKDFNVFRSFFFLHRTFFYSLFTTFTFVLLTIIREFSFMHVFVHQTFFVKVGEFSFST